MRVRRVRKRSSSGYPLDPCGVAARLTYAASLPAWPTRRRCPLDPRLRPDPGIPRRSSGSRPSTRCA